MKKFKFELGIALFMMFLAIAVRFVPKQALKTITWLSKLPHED